MFSLHVSQAVGYIFSYMNIYYAVHDTVLGTENTNDCKNCSSLKRAHCRGGHRQEIRPCYYNQMMQ